MQNWQPVNPAHAIEHVNATIRFAENIPELPWRKLVKKTQQLADKHGLVTERTVNDLRVSVPLIGNKSPGSEVQVVGYEFQRLERPDFYSEKIILMKDVLSFESWTYTRWNAFSKSISEILLEISQTHLELVPLRSIGLEYVDVFSAKEDNVEADITEVIQRESRFVAQAAYNGAEPFHCHSGFFDPLQSTPVRKRLTQVDIDIADVASKPSEPFTRVVRLRTSMADLYNLPRLDPLVEPPTTEAIADRFEELHIELKGVLESVITAEAADAVSLKG